MRPPGPPRLRSARPAGRGRCNPAVYAGQRRNTCLGMSASSRHTGQRVVLHCGSSHCREGACPTLCRHWVEMVQRPTLRWWTSTAVSLSPATGGGRHHPASRRYKQTVPPGRPGLDGTGARQSGRRPVRGVGTLVTSETAV